jgi:AraC-like DNA-binding protein
MKAGLEVETAVVPASTVLFGHRHKRWHLVLVRAGSLDEEVDGRVHTMSAGGCRISPPNATHNMVVGSAGLTCAIMSLDDAWVEPLSFPKSNLFLRSPTTVDPISEPPIGADKWTGGLRHELAVRKALAMLRAESDGRNPEHAPHWLEDAGAEMRLAPQTCRVERLVERSRVSRPHFSGAFQKHYGLRPVEYRTAHRLLSAVKQLLQTDTPIAEIAHDCGFADQSHLTRTLRSKLGVTPTHLRTSAAKPQPTIS